MNTAARLIAELAQHGCRARIIPGHRLRDLERAMGELCREVLAPELVTRYLAKFRYDYADRLPDVRSITVVAAPSPLARLSFGWRGERREMLIPPQYIASEIDPLVERIVGQTLAQNGYSWLRAQLPLKLLAVKSGLSQYGRNNISYIDDLGSYYRLLALVSDLPADEAEWGPARRMAGCEGCRICESSCPTGCIDPERDIIRAEKCLTHFNENSAPFPAWVERGWHNALIGCMKCQERCPHNLRWGRVEEIRDPLSEQEIDLILAAPAYADLPAATLATLERLNLTDLTLPDLQRNFRLLE